MLDHIWQSYTDADGVHHKLGAQVYYTTFLNTVRLFYDLEEYPINIAGIFMAHIDLTYAKGFCANYPNHGKVQSRVTLDQRCTLTKMLTALIKTENKVSKILDIVQVDQQGGKQLLPPLPKLLLAPPPFQALLSVLLIATVRTRPARSLTRVQSWNVLAVAVLTPGPRTFAGHTKLYAQMLISPVS